MANYNEQYRGSQPPPRSRYNDGDDSDYDEHTGQRFAAGSGRGWGDDNASSAYGRGSSRTGPANRPEYDREDSYRNEREREREGTVVERRERRQDDERSYVSRGDRSDGRRDRDRSRSASRSRSRSRDGFKEKLGGAFDTSGRGLGVGIAGALAGALAGRQIGKGKHAERDMIIGALVGGLGANAAEQGLRGYKDRKERDVRREEDRI